MAFEFRMTAVDKLFEGVDGVPAAATVRRITGPSIVVIGWIPFVSPLRYFLSAATSTYRNHSRRDLARVAFPFLFITGNRPSPPATFGRANGIAKFLSFLSLRQFRAAFAITDFTLYCDENGRPFRVTYRWLMKSGYTPIPLWPGPPLKGEGEPVIPDFSTLTGGDGIGCTSKLQFRIGGLGLKTAERFLDVVPWAQITVSYVLRANGSCDVSCEGTQIPSQTFYDEWVSQVNEGHNMLGNSESEITEFHFSGLEPPITKKWTRRW